jgi:Bifunctional DNA primase/polymerase, N-terminal
MVAAALALAASGLPVFGLVPRGKVPHRGSHGHLDATLNAAAIAEHWSRRPHDNIGVRPPAAMFVLDVDPRHGGETQLARLIANNGPLPRTWTARTGSGGRHYWFTTDVDAIKPTLCSGVDIKASTGFAVAPPSIHPNGRSYEWLTPPNGRPAAAPAWLQLAIQFPPRRPTPPSDARGGGGGQYSLQCLIARISRAQVGERNRTVYGALKDAWRQGDLDGFEPDLITTALAIGLPSNEVAAIVRSVQRGRR